MALGTDSIIQTLNNLIETCKDGQQGFGNAAETLSDRSLRQVFRDYADQRRQFATELQSQVTRLGGETETSGSATGALHRGWVNLKAAVTGGDDQSIVAEAERGEDQAVKAYKDALAQDLPATIRTLIERQYRQVQQAHDRVRGLRDGLERPSTGGAGGGGAY